MPSKTTSPRPTELGVVQPRGFPGLPAGWKSDWETFPSADKTLQLFGVEHVNERRPGHRALVVLHGMGEHGGRYLHLPHYLGDVVDRVYCMDHRGHGRSEGPRGDALRFDSLVDDVALVIERVREKLIKRFGRAEIHLLGHSLGGHLAIRVALLHPEIAVESITASAPFLAVAARVPLAKRAAARALSKVWGGLQIGTGLDPSGLSHDPAVVEAYKSDRLVHDKMTPRFYVGLMAAMADTLGHESGVRQPLQMIIPLADPIVSAEVAQAFFKRLQHRDKRLRTYPGFFHEPMNEVGKEEVFQDIKTWIISHSPAFAAAEAEHPLTVPGSEPVRE